MNIYTFRYIHNQTLKPIYLTIFETSAERAEKKARRSWLSKNGCTFDGKESVEPVCL